MRDICGHRDRVAFSAEKPNDFFIIVLSRETSARGKRECALALFLFADEVVWPPCDELRGNAVPRELSLYALSSPSRDKLGPYKSSAKAGVINKPALCRAVYGFLDNRLGVPIKMEFLAQIAL